MNLKDARQLPDRIAEYLADKIIRLELKPGQRLLEPAIAHELGVSRSPVREALHILNKQFLVEFLPRRGAMVADFSIPFIENLYDVLSALYVLLAETGLPKGTPEHLAFVEPILHRMEACADRADFEGYYDGMFQFTHACLKIAGNPLLEQIILNLWPSKRRMEYATLHHRRDSLGENLKFFLKGLNAFADGRFDEIEGFIRVYIQQEKECAISLAREYYLQHHG